MKKSAIQKILSAPEKPLGISKLPKRDLTGVELEDLNDEVHDGSKSFEEREQAYKEIVKRDPDLGRETVTNICRSLEHSGSRDIQDFIYFMLEHASMDIFMKLECALALFSAQASRVYEYFLRILIDYTTQAKETRPSITIYIDVLRYLLVKPLEEPVKEQITWFLTQSKLPADFLYKTIISIHKDEDRKATEAALDYLYTAYFQSAGTPSYQVLCAQYLLQKKPSICELTSVESTLLEIATNPSTEYNLRADSADVLIRLGSLETQGKAKAIIGDLGKDMTTLSTVYSNRQNVHDSDIEESVRQFLLDLGSIPANELTYEQIVEELGTYVEASKYATSILAVNGSLLRIKIDQILYPGSQSLSTIFVKIYTLISKHANKATLLERIIEELIDMDATCSSGHASRLVNVFSGIDGFNLRIGFKKQIQGNIAARISKAIQAEPNTELQELLLTEMTLDEHFERPNFLNFLKGIIGSIHQELYTEFVPEYLGAQEFETYFRDGVSFFETGDN